MNTTECLQCGTMMSDAQCVACDGAGKTEALALVSILAMIAAALGIYVWITLL